MLLHEQAHGLETPHTEHSAVTQAIIPIAGLSTRTKPMHHFYGKEFAFVGNTPLIEHIMHEAASAGMRNVAVIINSRKAEMMKAYRTMLDCAEKDFAGDQPMIDRLAAQREMSITEIVADHTKADGESIIQIEENWIDGDVPVAVLFGDDFILDRNTAEPVGLKELLSASYHTNGRTKAMIALQTLPNDQASKYGILRTAQETRDRLFRVDEVVEKPNRERLSEMFHGAIPDRLHTIVGKYVVSPEMVTTLRRLGSDRTKLEKGLRLADALAVTAAQEEGGVFGHEFSGLRFDTGNLNGIREMERFVLQQTFAPSSSQS